MDKNAPTTARRAREYYRSPSQRTTHEPHGASGEPSEQAAEVARLRAELDQARRRIAELEKLAQEDPLVPVLNRRGFMQYLRRALAFTERYGDPAALIFFDLDAFKTVNDEHGHAAGDMVLREVGRVLQDHVRASDIVARIGGDEFAILLWRIDADQAARKADKLVECLRTRRVVCAGQEIKLAASAGATALHSEDTAEAALARADRAMYAAKRQSPIMR